MPHPDYSQPTLLLPEALEAVLRIGVVGAGNHAQACLTVSSATDGVVLELESRPHFPLSQLESVIVEMSYRLAVLARSHVLPF